MQKNVIEDVFGTKVFNDDVMQEYLPKKIIRPVEGYPLKMVRSWLLK